MAKSRVVGSIQPVMAGVREILKCDAVASMLGEQAVKSAERCNRLYSLGSTPSVDPYGSKTVVRGYTAGGLVYTATSLGARDNLANNTLKKGCGV